MSTIKEIMWAAEDFAFSAVDCHSPLSDESDRQRCDLLRELLRDMIAAALADARREGAEQMREAAADEAIRRGQLCGDRTNRDLVEAILALPLPTGPRQAVRLTDEWIVQQVCDGFGATTNHWASHVEFARAIETAVFAANGIGDGDA